MPRDKAITDEMVGDAMKKASMNKPEAAELLGITTNHLHRIIGKSDKLSALYNPSQVGGPLPKPVELLTRSEPEPMKESEMVAAGARRYIHPGYSLPEFFKELNKRNIKYVVLRWFETLPEIEEDEDIDFLVADEDVEKFNELLVPPIYAGSQKIDLYSESGLKGTSYNALPYYQTNLAKEILENRTYHNEIYACPDPERHLLSLIYHIVYHKSEKSGIPVKPGGNYTRSEHDYAEVIKNICQQADLELPKINLKDLHVYLEKKNWAPSIDLIRKHSTYLSKDDCLATLYPKAQEKTSMTVYIIREWARDKNLIPATQKALEAEGLEILYTHVLSEDQIHKSKDILRGGNWGAGPWPVSGGTPYAIIVVLDQNPIENKSSTSHPFLFNEKFHRIKENLRRAINNKLPSDQRLNYLHCCDDTTECLEYLNVLLPDKKAEILKKKSHLENQLKCPFPIIENYSRFQRRSHVKLVNYKGRKAVCKIFKKNREVFMEREIKAYGKLSKSIKYIPKLLETGPNWILIEYIDHDPDKQQDLLKNHLREAVDVTKKLWESNHAHLDLHPNNTLISKSGELYLIDFEFLYEYPVRPPFSESYDLTTVPENIDVGRIDEHENIYHSHCKIWKSQTGFTLPELVEKFS